MVIYLLLISSLLSISLVQSNQKSEIIITVSAAQDLPEKKEDRFFKQDKSDTATPFFSALSECIDNNYGLVITPDLVTYFIAHYIGQQLSLDSSYSESNEQKIMTEFFRTIVDTIDSDYHQILQCTLHAQYDLVKAQAQEVVLARNAQIDIKQLSRIKLSGTITSWQKLYDQVGILIDNLPTFNDYLENIKLLLEYIDDAYNDDDIDTFFWQDLFSYDKKLSYAHGFLLRLVPGAQLAPIISNDKGDLSGVLSCTIDNSWVTLNIGFSNHSLVE